MNKLEKPNYNNMLDGYILRLKLAYQYYKKEYNKFLEFTYYDSNGVFCFSESLKDRVNKASEEVNNRYYALKGFKEYLKTIGVGIENETIL